MQLIALAGGGDGNGGLNLKEYTWHYISVGGWSHSFTLRPSNVPRIPHLAFFWCNLAFTLERRKRKRQQPLATHATCRPLGD